MGNTYAEKVAALGGGLVRTRVFDSSDLTQYDGFGSDYGILMGNTEVNPVFPVLDTSVLASGQPSIKFTVPTLSSSGAAGSYHLNFSADRFTQFGEGQSFYVQFMVKWGRFMVEHTYTSTSNGGWKTCIIGTGDAAGASCVYHGTTVGCAPSHSTMEHVINQYSDVGHLPIMYHDVNGSSFPLQTDFASIYDNSDIKLQPGVDRVGAPTQAERYCLYTQRNDVASTYGGCVTQLDGFVDGSATATRWATITVKITVGTLSGSTYLNTRCESWWAWTGESEVKWIDKTYDQPFSQFSPEKFGKLWLLPYLTSKSTTENHTESYVWYANPIISTTLPALTTDEPGTGLAMLLR